ncbi:MAG: sigma-54 dependent transcriptional regulator [Acidobacteria bacterium]|nr:sigma-54 dependent transcriptional regulator [Acidobacteriota bacterium]
MAHDNEILTNQEKILANQEIIKQNQEKLDLLLTSQESILPNQETIREEHLKLDLLLANNDRLLDARGMLDEMIGASPGFKRALREALSVAHADTTVLIRGETGTGKELLAQAIHAHSARSRRPFVTINCAALPSSLIESELFGHEKGAFTGALQRRPGRFEVADTGTIFLDEIGEVPLETQGKFLRVLQRREFERIGSTQTIRINVRVIAATNQSLEVLVAERKFRTDLFYRLNVFPITLPPLRDRREDIKLLIEHFVKKYSARFKKRISSIDKESLERLYDYHWPGNIRELEHLVERAVLVTDGNVLAIELPETFIGPVVELDETLSDQSPEKNLTGISRTNEEANLITLAENERSYIEQVLRYTSGRIAGPDGAAAILGVPPSTLRSRMKKLGLKVLNEK